jgi:hypothetical protein
MPICPSCAAPVTEGHRFCGACGATLADTPAPAPVPAPAEPEAGGAGRPRSFADTASAFVRRARPELPAVQAAALDAVTALAVQIGVLLVVVAVAALTALPSGEHGSPVDWFRSAVWVAGLALGGAVTLDVSGSESVGRLGHATGEMHLAASAVPLLATLTALVAVWWLARRRERTAASRDVAVALGSAVSTAATYAVVLGVLALATRATSGYGFGGDAMVDGSAGLGLGRAAAGALVLTFLAAAAGRADVRLRATRGTGVIGALRARLGGWDAPLTAAVGATAVALVLAAVVVLGTALSAGERVPAVLTALLLLPNAAVLVAGAAMGATAVYSVEGGLTGELGSLLADEGLAATQEGAGLLAGQLPSGWLYLGVLLPIVAVLAAGLRYGQGRPPGERAWTSIWRFALSMAGVWLLLGLVTRMRVGGEFSATAGVLGEDAGGAGSGSASSGLGLPSLLLVALVWGALTFAVGRMLTRPVAATFPRSVAALLRLPGAPVHPQWAALLADGITRLGRPVPARVAAAHTEPLTVPPLRVSRRRAAFVGVGALALVVAAGGLYTAKQVVGSVLYGPEATVDAYLDALADADAGTALTMLDGEPEGAALTDAALRVQKAAGGLDSVDVGGADVDEDGTTATVPVEYEAGGETRRVTLELRRDDEESRLGLFPVWRIGNGLSSVGVSGPSAITGYSVNGQGVADSDEYSVPVFPGPVVVTGEVSEIVDTEAVTAVAPFGDGIEVALEARLSETGQKAVRKMVEEHLAACLPTRSGDNMFESDCLVGYDDYESSSPEDIRWTVVSPPEVTSGLGDDGQIAVQGAVGLRVSYTYEESGGEPATKVDETVPVEFDGYATFEGEYGGVGLTRR